MNKGVFIFWVICIGAALIRVAGSFGYNVPDIGPCLKNEVSGSGTIIEEPERKESGQVFVVEILDLIPRNKIFSSKIGINTNPQNAKLDIPCGRGIHIRMKAKLYPRFSFGDTVAFTGKLSQPFNFKSESGRSFDYKGYLAKDDIFFEIKSATVQIAHSTTMSGTGIFDKISAGLFWLKRHFVANLENALGEPHAALAAGLVVGEKAALGKALLDDFRTVGLIHIVVLSGYNITVVADAMRRILSFLPRVWGISVGGVGIALFGILVGGGATVVRSCLMAAIALSANLIRRDYNVSRALIFVALLMLIQNPSILLNDPSFQLSFLATLGLILLASPIESKLSFIPEKFGMRGIVASTIATQIFVSPYILYMMGQISIIGMVVNILVLPFIPVTMLAVTLTGAAGFLFPTLSHWIGWSAHVLLSYELFMVNNFAKIPFASAHLPAFSFGWVVAFYVIFTCIYLYFIQRSNFKNN